MIKVSIHMRFLIGSVLRENWRTSLLSTVSECSLEVMDKLDLYEAEGKIAMKPGNLIINV